MKIAIDVSPIIYGTGVSVYTKNLVQNLLDLDNINRYILFGGSLRRFKELKSILRSLRTGKQAKCIERSYPLPPLALNLLWNRLHIINIENFVGKVDIFHSSDWTQPPSKAFKVTTIHDLSPILFPNLSHPSIVSAHKDRLKWVIKEADRVLVPSITTSRDVMKLGVDNSKIRVINEAVDPLVKPANKLQIGNMKRKYRISGRYILAVGVNPRKNTERIIRAFEAVRPNIDLKLVIIGHPYSKISAQKGVIFTGHVSQEILSAFYSGSEALVYPSLYEGFGLPILEAFNTGIPVVTSNIGSMAEIGKGAAILVNPNQTESISEGIIKALKNKKDLIKNGLSRAKDFSWEKTAKETLNVYTEAER